VDPISTAKAAMGFYDAAKKVATTVAATTALKDRDEIISFVRQAETIYDEKLAGDRKRRELEEALRFKELLTYEHNVYWAGDDPDPYCSGCFDASKTAVRLTRNLDFPSTYTCPVCGKGYATKPRPPRPPRAGSFGVAR
jgi:hypothetical protein